jgi:hypothetical protein
MKPIKKQNIPVYTFEQYKKYVEDVITQMLENGDYVASNIMLGGPAFSWENLGDWLKGNWIRLEINIQNTFIVVNKKDDTSGWIVSYSSAIFGYFSLTTDDF